MIEFLLRLRNKNLTPGEIIEKIIMELGNVQRRIERDHYEYCNLVVSVHADMPMLYKDVPHIVTSANHGKFMNEKGNPYYTRLGGIVQYNREQRNAISTMYDCVTFAGIEDENDMRFSNVPVSKLQEFARKLGIIQKDLWENLLREMDEELNQSHDIDDICLVTQGFVHASTFRRNFEKHFRDSVLTNADAVIYPRGDGLTIGLRYLFKGRVSAELDGWMRDNTYFYGSHTRAHPGMFIAIPQNIVDRAYRNNNPEIPLTGVVVPMKYGNQIVTKQAMAYVF